MPRTRKSRRVEFMPRVTYFKPAGVPIRELEEIVLTVEELEAIRLKDQIGLDQEECARRMKISRPTFFRVISSARKKIADTLVSGTALRIEGGHFQLGEWRHCPRCNNRWKPSEQGEQIEQPYEECPVCGN